MVCEQYFQAELETVKKFAVETVRWCPRCEQLIEEATGMNKYGRADALDVLGLSPGAIGAEIKDAYRSLVTEVRRIKAGHKKNPRKFNRRMKPSNSHLSGAC